MRNMTYIRTTLNLDIIVSILGIFGLIALSGIFIYLNVLQPLGLMVVVFLTLFAYLLRRDCFIAIRRFIYAGEGLKPISLIAYIVIFILQIFCNFVIVYYSIDTIARPLWIFISLAILFGIIFLQAQFVAPQGPGESILFTQILVFLVTLVMSSLLVLPFNGGDTWAHIFNAENVVKTASIQGEYGAYRDYPLYPALASEIMLITGSDSGTILRLLTVLLSGITLSLFYAFGRIFFASARQTILMVLLLLGSKWFLYWSTLVVSMNTSLFLFAFFFVVLNLQIFRKSELKGTILLFVIASVAPFFHPVAAFAICVLSFVYWIASLVFPDRNSRFKYEYLLVLSLFVIVVTLTQWIYYGGTFDRAIIGLASSIFQESPYSVKIGTSVVDPIFYTIDNLNFYVLLALSILAVLVQIRFGRERLILYSGLGGLFFVVFGYSTEIINLQAVLPYR